MTMQQDIRPKKTYQEVWRISTHRVGMVYLSSESERTKEHLVLAVHMRRLPNILICILYPTIVKERSQNCQKLVRSLQRSRGLSLTRGRSPCRRAIGRAAIRSMSRCHPLTKPGQDAPVIYAGEEWPFRVSVGWMG